MQNKILIALLGLCGCGGNFPAQTAPTTRPVASESPATRPAPLVQDTGKMKRPFMIGEASLPEGYPPPSPVGEVVVKDYPASREAVVRSNVGENGMFQALFNHIQRNDIAMTAPVKMGYEGDPGSSPMASMAFLYRQPTWGKTGPDQDVTVVDVPPMKVLSVAFRGSYSTDTYAKAAAVLQKWLKDHPGQYEAIGSVRVLGYNSPFVPGFLKYGEVQIPIRPWKAP